MTLIDRRHVSRLFARGDAARNATDQGRALEDVIAYVFEQVPGVSVTARNVMNAFAAEELDVAFYNDGASDGLQGFDLILLVECKNWSSPAGYQELAVFLDKLQSRGRPMGIFVAAKGITGDPAERSRAHSVLARALASGREILVLTRTEIEDLESTEQLIRLLKHKRAQLAVSGTIYGVAARGRRT